ncbi:MAG: inverse autotransporter beta domain-containing protein, partial [Gemmataceae bacterium]
MNLLDRMLSALVLSGFLCLTGRAEEATTKVPDPQPAAAGGLPLMAGPASGSVIDELFGKYLPRLGYSYDAFNTVGREGGLSAFQMFVPIYESGTSTQLLFSDSRFLLFDNGGTVGANLGLGGRLFSESINRTLGGYVYWDYSDTGRASFRQVSGGLETLGDKVDARANFYLPVGRDRKVVDQVIVPSAEPTFQNHYLLVGGGQGTRSTEQALYGFDTEAGYKIVALEGLELRAFAGMYHYQSDDATTQAWGPRGRLEARLRDTMAMGVSLQNDRIFGTTVNLNVMLSYPRLSGRSYSDGPSAPLPASDRLGDPIIRQQQISVQRSKETFTVAGSPVVDPLTGKPYYFLHVAPGGNSDGSVESPYGTLAAAFADPRFSQGNLVVYDRTNGTYMGNVQLAPGTRLLSSGPVQVLDTTQGTVLLPHSGSQASGAFMPRIQGSIRLANNTMLSGFDVVGQGRAAIFANPGEPLRNVVIRNNRISGGLA